MKKGAVRITTVPFVIGIVFIALIFVSGNLYKQNRVYQNTNRRLIILNDSILSANIVLQNQLKQKDSVLADHSAITRKATNKQ